MEERLQKLMARAGLGSRRQNEGVIAAGRVRVNGRIAHLGDKADPTVDQVTVDGQPLRLPAEKLTYVMLHKPKGVITSLEDELDQNRPTVRDLVPVTGHIYPVGRLDRQSEGLILMTNDGKLAHRLTHPRYAHEKVYSVQVAGAIGERALEQWRRGVMLDGRLTAPAPIELLERYTSHTRLRIVLREGRKRQIRRVAALLGHPVQRLVREKIGPLSLGDLPPGGWRHLTPDEVNALRAAAGSQPGQKKGNKRRSRSTP